MLLFFGVGWFFWYHSSEQTLLPNLVIFQFEIPEVLQEEVIVSGFIPGKPLPCLAPLGVNLTYPVRETQSPQPRSAFSDPQTLHLLQKNFRDFE